MSSHLNPDPDANPGYISPPFDASTPPPPPPKPSRNPPTPQEKYPSPTPNSAPPRPSQHPSQSSHPPPPSPSDHWLPPILLDKPTTALQPVLSSPPLLTALVQTHPSLTPSPLPPHLVQTAHLASHLLTRHAHLLTLRTRTQTHLLQLRALEHQWRAKQAQMDAQLEPWAAKSLYLRLVKAEREGEEVSRAVEESWMDGGGEEGAGDLEGFLRRYKEGRRLVGRRREMRERWDEGRVGGWR